MIDYKRLDAIKIRNVDEKIDFHDLVKTLLVRMLRRKHPNKEKYPIYTEFSSEEPNKTYPDIEFSDNGRIVVYELQEVVTQQWIERMNQKYDDLWIMVELKKVKQKWDNRMLQNWRVNKTLDPLRDLKIVLEEYVV